MEKKRFTVLPEWIQQGFLKLIDPVIDLIVQFNVHPHFFTVLGLVLSGVSAYFFATGDLRMGGMFVLLGGICDILDGKIARRSGLSSKFGALLDSSLDRYAEMFMYLGIGIYFVREGNPATSMMVFLALGGSLMVSYVRARAEGLGYDCKVGLMQRPERIVYIGFGAILHALILEIVIWMVAILANFTAFQRMQHVWKLEKKEKEAEEQEEPLDESLGI
ncbi:MAG: CDP-alcohol phosphatidyltransferase family protein [Calditrichaeota bacterium]|nr:CDP-alcohol phosphatidyltransferase family protein [Calditrichota bacterium]